MELYTLNPLLDPRWDEFVARHPRASVFHRTGWLRALARTYGFQPVVLSTSRPDEQLADGIAFCEIRSWITGTRLVSLPFSDHAEPLLWNGSKTLEVADWVQTASAKFGWRYVEFRPISVLPEWSPTLETSRSFWLHTLNLKPPLEQLYANLHKDCIRRRIRHADRQHLAYERGASCTLIDQFYGLMVMTRRRHRLLPAPKSWFRNLVSEMSPDAEIRLVRDAGIPVAAILTLHQGATVVYKYGCSNQRFHHLAGMPFLLWRLIEESKAEGAEVLDLGRTECDNRSVIAFKDRLGASRTILNYYRYSDRSASADPANRCERSSLRYLLSYLPGAFSSGLGGALYRHVG